MMYLPGMAFLFLVCSVIALPLAVVIKHKTLAIFLSVCLSTLILKTWAYFAMSGFDLGFLTVLIVIGFCASVAVTFGVEKIRQRV